MNARRRVVALLIFAAAGGCDDSEAFHELNPSWSRMLEQPRADAYEATPVFADGKVMQRPPRGTIPHDFDRGDPPPLTRELVVLGRARFEIVCAACHGILGDGHSVVAEKMRLRPPPSLGEARIRAMSAATLVQVISDGYGFMPSYADAVAPRERWAVAAYVKALQVSQSIPAADLPPDLRNRLSKESP